MICKDPLLTISHLYGQLQYRKTIPLGWLKQGFLPCSYINYLLNSLLVEHQGIQWWGCEMVVMNWELVGSLSLAIAGVLICHSGLVYRQILILISPEVIFSGLLGVFLFFQYILVNVFLLSWGKWWLCVEYLLFDSISFLLLVTDLCSSFN